MEQTRNTGAPLSFYGIKISETGQEAGRVDFRTLGKIIGGVLNNEIMGVLMDLGQPFELENGEDTDENGEPVEFFQFFVISQGAAQFLKEWTTETVYSCEPFALYIWAVSHWGTPWEDVLTGIKWNEERKQWTPEK